MSSLLSEILAEAEQGSDMWLKLRIGKFTSSRMKELIFKRGDLTVGALSYITEKASEIITGEEEPFFESEDMAWGTAQEPEARRIYQEKTGLEVEQVGFILHNEFYGGSPDGLIEPEGVLEIKCPGKSKNHIKNMLCDTQEKLKKNRPDAYWQIQSNLFLTKRSWAHFISYDPRLKGMEFFILHVKRDEKDIELMNECIKEATGKLQEILALSK